MALYSVYTLPQLCIIPVQQKLVNRYEKDRDNYCRKLAARLDTPLVVLGYAYGVMFEVGRKKP